MGNKNQVVTEEDIMNLLNSCYEKCLTGIPKVSSSVEDMANEYLKKYETPEDACKAMLKNQVAKCTTSGFVTGFGGFITMPVAIPANVGSVFYVQMRMIACVAYMADYELSSDQTQTFVYACMAGVAVNGLLKQAGIKFGVKFANEFIKKIPGKVLTQINQKVGFRFITKFGTKGVVNLGKLLPGVGAVVSGGLDFAETKIIANRAYKWFFKGDFSVKSDNEENVIEIDNSDYEKYNEELVEIFVKAAGNAFFSLKENYKEQFYYYAFIFDEGMHPYISAWSYEALDKSISDNKITDEEKSWWKWDYSDSPYVVYGYDEFFNEVSELLDKRASELSDDELYDMEWDIRVNSMEEAMKRLDQSGLFGINDDRKRVVINVEIAPPDCSEYNRALRLNPESSLLSEYLECCEEPEDN